MKTAVMAVGLITDVSIDCGDEAIVVIIVVVVDVLMENDKNTILLCITDEMKISQRLKADSKMFINIHLLLETRVV